MKLHDLLIPFSYQVLYNRCKENQCISISTYIENQEIQNVDVFILGYLEDRNSNNIGASIASQKIREQLYQLYSTSHKLNILDLGDCIQGKTVKESYFVLQEVCKILKTYDKPIILIGGTQEASYYIAKEYFKKVQFPTYTYIDSKLDIELKSEDFSNCNYIQKIQQINQNVRIVNIANQECLSHISSFNWFKTNYFPLYRLGDVLNTRIDAEPLIRDAQVVSFDASSIRYSDFMANIDSNPIGLFSEDACQLGWYSGFSPNMKVFHFTEYNPTLDSNNISSKLAAHIVWHVLDGISQRKTNFLDFSAENYKCYYVKNNFLEQDLPFFEDLTTHQLWVEIPLKRKNRKRILPCSKSDYQSFISDDLPENWMIEFNRVYQKN